VHPDSQCIDAVVVHQRALVLDDKGELAAAPVPVYFLSSQVLGTLIVFEDMGLIHHELVLIEHRLVAISDPHRFLGPGPPGDRDPSQRVSPLKHWLQRRVEESVARVELRHEAVYFVVLGDVFDGPEECLAFAASNSPTIR